MNILHSLNETERSKWDTLVDSHFKAWMDQRLATDTGQWGTVKNLKGSKAYMSLPEILQKRAKDHHLNSERTNWYLLKGEIAESGSGVAHDAIIIPKGEWSSAGIADWEIENNDKLSTLLGHPDKSTWYKRHPDLLLVNQKIKNRAFEIADNDLFKVAARVGDTETYTSLFTKPNISTFSDEQVVTLLDLLEDSQDLSRDEQIQTLAILFGENPEKFMDEPEQGGKVVPLTKTFLETVFQKEQDKILSTQDKKNQRGIQTSAGKTRKLLLDYKSVLSKPNIDPGLVGTVKELYYLVWENDSSVVNRVFSGKAGKGRKSPSDGKEMEESTRVLELLMNDPTAKLLQNADDGEYYYINSAGKKVIVEAEVIEQMGRELDAAYSESYYYGRKKALELFLGYTMARSFDDQGRISDKDLDMQLKTFRGDWKSNFESVSAAIDVGLDMVEDQIAIANGLLADGIEYEVIGPDGQKHITVWDINKMKATQLWRQLLTRRDSDGETIQQKRMYTLFNIYTETLPGAAHKIKKEEGATFMGNELYRVTQTLQVDGKDLNPTGLNKKMYAYKEGDAWVKVPWNRLKEIKFGNVDSSGEVPDITPLLRGFTFVDGTVSDVYHSNGKMYYDKELTQVLSTTHEQEINQ